MEDSMSITLTELVAQLKDPFHPGAIEWLPKGASNNGNRVRLIPYLNSTAIQDRLDDVCGPAGWESSTEVTQVTLSSKDGPKADVAFTCILNLWDPSTERWSSKCDGAGTTQVEAIKGGFSDAFKRAARVWGVGRYLVHLPQFWIELTDQRPSWNDQDKWVYYKRQYARKPRLPDWALPGNEPQQSRVLQAATPELVQVEPVTIDDARLGDWVHRLCIEARVQQNHPGVDQWLVEVIEAAGLQGRRIGTAQAAAFQAQLKSMGKPTAMARLKALAS
jgi:hypothetical protein